MGVRYRKSVKILPGVRVNISKSGLSTTIGPKGASVNIGKKGVYANTGIPGTGVYMREKISGSQSSTRTKSSSKGPDPEFMRLFEAYKPISLKIDNTGKVVVLGKDNMVITDEYFLKKLKSMNAYKNEKEQLVAAWKERSEEEYQKARGSISELINIHQYSFDVKPVKAYEQELAKIRKQEYQKQTFDEKEPTKQQVEACLASYADVHITTKAFWRVNKLRSQYVQENLEPQYQKQHSEWENRRADFDIKQQKIADSLNATYEKEYIEKCDATRQGAFELAEQYHLKDVKLFPQYEKPMLEMFGYIPRIPSFQQLAIMYEKTGRYQEAIDICNLALEYGLKDNTKGGFEGRLAKLQKKAINQ